MIKSKKVIVFQLDQVHYAIDIVKVRSIEKMMPITDIPMADESVLGITNLRGSVIPVLDLKKRLGGKVSTILESSRILVINVNGTDIGLVVDSANDVIDLEENVIDTSVNMRNESGSSFIEGIAKLDSLVVLLNLETLLNWEIPLDENILALASGLVQE